MELEKNLQVASCNDSEPFLRIVSDAKSSGDDCDCEIDCEQDGLEVLLNCGGAIISGKTKASGENSAKNALVEVAQKYALDKAKGLAFCFKFDAHYPLEYVQDAMSWVDERVNDDADCYFYTHTSDEMKKGEVEVAFIIAGLPD